MKSGIRKYRAGIGIGMVLLISLTQLCAQISPGELAEPHSFLEGLSNCTKCHILGKKVSGEKCLDCHLEIGIRISEKRGYHASADVGEKNCIECHSDHHGNNFQMIRFDTDKFNHTLTGYKLSGAHAMITCRSCHKTENITDAKIRLKPSTYLGLVQKCQVCHADYHQGTLSPYCASCHDFNKFNPASKFDHTKARFSLRGKHATVDCLLCHSKSVQNGKVIQKFTGLSYGKCTNCHKDIHENKFGQNCTKCHSEESFHQIRGLKSFNHSLTSYPLEGKHRSVACTRCHKSGYTKSLNHSRCIDCHKDYHNNEFMIQGKSPDCSDCHSLLGFERSSYTIERHNESQFQITGGHLATPCFACHKKSGKWSFRSIGENCVDCHKNIHDSKLDVKYFLNSGCKNCHSSQSWSEISFDHSKTGYILEGAHIRQLCRSCHFKPGKQGLPFQQFSNLSDDCTECHKDVHYNQFGESRGTVCLKCHDYFDWSAGLFDHNRSAFPLVGKHKDIACNKCHPLTATAQNTYILYKLKNFTCESCH